ncbi:ATPase, T2SS/T4P/T4SS family, partial [Rhizobium ruizarguesonis]
LLPPIVPAPCFSIRRRASQRIRLEDYVTSSAMTAGQALVIRQAIDRRWNMVICGGTGSGKTTLTNAVVAAIAEQTPNDRLVIL